MKTQFLKKKLSITASIVLVLIVTACSFWYYNSAVTVNASGAVSIDIELGSGYGPGEEIVPERTENAKKYYLADNSYALDVSLGVIHYKDNYEDQKEEWKDIDLTFEDGKITRAPYILTVDEKNKSFTVFDKKTGQTTTLGLTRIGNVNLLDAKNYEDLTPDIAKGKILWSNIDTDLDLSITAENSRVSFDWIVKSENAPHEVEFEIKDGGIPISYQGMDAEGNSIEVITSMADGKITERIEKGGKYPVIVNPVIDFNIGASADDCLAYIYNSNWVFSNGGSAAMVGDYSSNIKMGSGLRFPNITIPAESTITSSYLSFKAYGSQTGTVKSRITGDKENNPTAWASLSDYQTRRGTVVGGANNNYITTTQVSWDDIANWTDGTWYNSPDISTVIQELVDAHAPSNEAMALYWDDHERRSSQTKCRKGCSYDYNPSTNAPKLHIEYTDPTPSISNTPSSYNFDAVGPSAETPTGTSAFSVTNNSGSSVNITISGTDLTGGIPWTLSDTAAPGSATAGIKAGLSGGSYNIIVKQTAPFNTLKSNLANGASQSWGFQLLAPTNYTDAVQKAGTITLTATVN